MLLKQKMLVLMLRRMDQSGRENLLPVENLFPQCGGDHLQFEEVHLLEGSPILLHGDVWNLLFVVE